MHQSRYHTHTYDATIHTHAPVTLRYTHIHTWRYDTHTYTHKHTHATPAHMIALIGIACSWEDDIRNACWNEERVRRGVFLHTKQNLRNVDIYKCFDVSIQPNAAKMGLEMVLETEIGNGNASDFGDFALLQCVAACCSVFKCGSVCGSEL